MDWSLVLKFAVAVAPVVIALLLFDRLDVFDLVSFRALFTLLLIGAGLGAACLIFTYIASNGMGERLPIGFSDYSRYVAPFIEEGLKAAVVVVLFASNRIGFKLDSAISGFAVGAGFSVFENFYLLFIHSHENLAVWMVRGLGTAMMHGGATAIFAVVSHEFTERQAEGKVGDYRFNPLLYIPGYLIAVIAHSTFNHFPNYPLQAMMGALLLVPITLFMVFFKSEKATHMWILSDYETHTHALEDMRSGAFAASDAGQQIERLAKGYRTVTAAQVFAYIELLTELILRAEQLLLDMEAGRGNDSGQHDLDKFAELHALEKALGRTVLAALKTHLPFSRNDLWELHELEAMIHQHLAHQHRHGA